MSLDIFLCAYSDILRGLSVLPYPSNSGHITPYPASSTRGIKLRKVRGPDVLKSDPIESFVSRPQRTSRRAMEEQNSGPIWFGRLERDITVCKPVKDM